VPINITQNTTREVREDTAELASWALSDIASSRSGNTPTRQHLLATQHNHESPIHHQSDHEYLSREESNRSARDAIVEVSEPSSPNNSSIPQQSPGASALTQMIRNSPPNEHESASDITDNETYTGVEVQPVAVGQGIISQPNEQTALLLQKAAQRSPVYGTVEDLESQIWTFASPIIKFHDVFCYTEEHVFNAIGRLMRPKSWDKQFIWQQGVRQPLAYVPPVILGVLLNILDALSYGSN